MLFLFGRLETFSIYLRSTQYKPNFYAYTRRLLKHTLLTQVIKQVVLWKLTEKALIKSSSEVI